MPIPNLLPDNHQLRQWQEGFLRLNHLRLERATSLMPPRQQRLLELLPLLLHINHAQLPGFVDRETPAGIEHYHPPAAAIRAARSLLPNSPQLDRPADGPRDAISALFLMGSLGSLAQSRSSDLDVWVCLQHPLAAEQQQRLQRKCQRIEQWAITQGVELHLFVMDLQQFRQGQHQDSDGENCGSSQFLLLLDEFYRSALWLAGRWPRWWLVPVAEEQRASDYWQELLEAHLTHPDLWLDLGDLPGIPPEEFIGAALWQLSKSLGNPYKALLKLALCRHYAEQYPHIRPLAWDLKELIQHPGDMPDNDLEACDAYLLLIQRITSGQPANERYHNMIRRAFYYKTGLQLSQTQQDQNDWRRPRLLAITRQWQWTAADLVEFDSRDQWLPQRVFQERNELVADMLATYRQLSMFSQRHDIQCHINATDLRLLGNQLSAALDARPGKIQRLNPGISHSLVQSQLTLLRYPGVWQLACGRWTSPPPDRQIIRQSQSLVELLLFSLHNDLWQKGTGLHTVPAAQAITAPELQQLLLCLRQLVQRYQYASDWQELPRLRHLHLFINVATDPLDQYSRAGLQKLSDLDDPLNFSSSHHNLVASVDLLSINSWNEWQVQRIEGPRAFAEILPVIMDALARRPRPTLEVHCFNPNRPARIRQRVLALLTSMLVHQRRHAGLFVFALGEHWWCLNPPADQHQLETFADHNAGQCQRLENEEALWPRLQTPQRPGFHPPAFDARLETRLPVSILSQNLSDQHWQLFYQREGSLLTFYLADECGSLLRQHVRYEELTHWLLPTLRFLTRLQQRWPRLNNRHIHSLRLFELRLQPDGWACLPRPLPDLDNRSSPIELTAVFDHDNQPTLYCNHEEFSIWQYGHQLYQAVAQRVISLRSRQETYPCYLSDLQFHRGAGLLVLWEHKQTVEQRLADALRGNPSLPRIGSPASLIDSADSTTR